MLRNKGHILKVVLSCYFAINLIGCATNKNLSPDPQDPYEHFNRKVFAFNMAVDKAFYRPVAKVYDKVVPLPAKKGVRNFFGNIGDLTSAANEILQLHFPQAIADLARIIINTTIGIGGLFDVATPMGLEKDKEDFGLTLARWGSKNTPYLVLPFIGPFTLRDVVGAPVDYFLLSIWPYVRPDLLYYSLRGTYYVQLRATLLAGDDLVDQAFDPYIFVRNAYLQRRSYLIKESEEKHVTKFVDEKGIVHRRHRSIPVDSIVSK